MNLSTASTNALIRALRAYGFVSTDPLPWWKDALCAQYNGDDWFPLQGEWTRTQEARNVCRQCPVVEACLAESLANPSLEGVWAGTTERERHGMRRNGTQQGGTAA